MDEIFDEQIVKEEYFEKDNTFFTVAKYNPKDLIEVEIGDSKVPTEFLPQFKIMRWDNEVNFSMRAEVDPKATVDIKDGVVKYIATDYEVHQYEKPEASEDGGFEFEWVLPSLPKSNVLTATIQSKELDFFYQPALTEKEIEDGAERPDNIVGSYAVYHKSKRDNIVGGKEYKTGKAFHIYRPEAIDVKGGRTWCELNIDEANGVLTVTVPQKFLDTAVYPVVVDPTFGYTTAGGTWDSTGANTFRGSTFASPESGTVTSITHFLYNSASGNRNVNFGFYNGGAGSIGTHVARGVSTSIAKSFNNWQTINVSGSVSAADYWLVAQGGATAFWAKYDTGATNQGGISTAITYDTWSDSPSLTYSTRKYSIYATYTTASSNDFVIANADSASSADNIVLTVGGGTLAIADLASASSIDNIALTQNGGTLAVADEASASSIDNITLQFQGTFIIANADSLSSADNIAIIRNGGDFQVADENSASSIDNIALIGELVSASIDSESSIDNIAIVRNGGDFVIADVDSSSNVDNITIAQSGSLLTADIEVTSGIDNIVLAQNGGTLTIADSNATTNIENIALIGNLIIGDIVSGTSIEGITLGFNGGTFVIGDLISATEAEQITLIGDFKIDSINSPPTIDNIDLAVAGGAFAIDDTHSASNVQSLVIIEDIPNNLKNIFIINRGRPAKWVGGNKYIEI